MSPGMGNHLFLPGNGVKIQEKFNVAELEEKRGEEFRSEKPEARRRCGLRPRSFIDEGGKNYLFSGPAGLSNS
jgi:hypothetical protein